MNENRQNWSMGGGRMNFTKAKKELLRELKERGTYSDCSVGIRKNGDDYEVVIASLPNYDPCLNGAQACLMTDSNNYLNEHIAEVRSWTKF